MKKFIAGMVTALVAIPVSYSLVELIQVAIELPKGLISRRIVEINKEIQELGGQEYSDTNCIGFQVPTEEYYGDDE